MQLPDLPYPDEEIRQVVVRRCSDEHGEAWTDLRIHRDRASWEYWTVEQYDSHEAAVEVAIALRKRIRAVRRLLGREVEALAV